MKSCRRIEVTGAWRSSLAVTLVALFAACGSVEVPQPMFYRLPAPRPTTADYPIPAVLRVDRLHLATNLSGDQLVVADGPVRVQRYELHRWAGPIDGLVLDALVTGFARSRGFREVKAPGDVGDDDFVLSGTILDFHEERVADGAVGRVTLDLRLFDRRSGDELFRDEFTQTVDAGRGGPDLAARALSEGLGRVVGDVLARAHAAGVAATPR